MLRPLCPALQEKAARELSEKPERIPSDIKAIREWLEKQPHLQAVKPTDQWLLSFLRGNKFSLERTKEKLDMYYSLKTIVPEFLRNRNPFDPKIQEILKMGIYLPLTEVTAEDGCCICLCRIGQYDPNEFHMIDVLKVIAMITEILIFEDDNFIISGEDVLVDFKGAGLLTFSHWTPAVAKKILYCMEKAMPVRMKSNHMINVSAGFEAAHALYKAFVSEKQRSRVRNLNGLWRLHIHGKNYEALYNAIPRYILPKEYEGETSTIQELTDHWKAKVESYSDWFLNEDERSDESLRPEKPRTSSSLFGVEGSFRKLDVD